MAAYGYGPDEDAVRAQYTTRPADAARSRTAGRGQSGGEVLTRPSRRGAGHGHAGENRRVAGAPGVGRARTYFEAGRSKGLDVVRGTLRAVSKVVLKTLASAGRTRAEAGTMRRPDVNLPNWLRFGRLRSPLLVGSR